jgi:hypothetical protein
MQTTPDRFCRDMKERGALLHVEDGDIVVYDTRCILNDSLRKYIREHKLQILQVLEPESRRAPESPGGSMFERSATAAEFNRAQLRERLDYLRPMLELRVDQFPRGPWRPPKRPWMSIAEPADTVRFTYLEVSRLLADDELMMIDMWRNITCDRVEFLEEIWATSGDLG